MIQYQTIAQLNQRKSSFNEGIPKTNRFDLTVN